MTSISDKLLIKAASEYVYDISHFDLYEDPVSYVSSKLKNDFKNRYTIKDYQNKEFTRDGKRINLRYLLIEDSKSFECALIFQGSDGDIVSAFSGEDNDWSNNLNLAAKLNSHNYYLALEEFQYLKVKMNYNITALSGNSLGGGYSLFIKEHYKDLRVIGLNPAPNILDGHFTEDESTTNLLISSDILSRSLILDESRTENINKNRLSQVYGLKPYMIKRTIPLFNEDTVLLAHVGVMSNYRKVIIKLFNDNFLYYNAKILIEGKDKADFTKMIFKRLYAELDRSELIKFTDYSIYPVLSELDKKIVDTYREYPGISEFIFYDLMSNNLLSVFKRSKVDNKTLINNFSDNNNQFINSSKFFLENSKYEIMKITDKSSPLYTSPKFLTEKLNLSLSMDYTYAKLFISLPQTIRSQLISILEANFILVLNLNNRMSKAYDIKQRVSSVTVNDYIEEINRSIILLESMFSDLEYNLKIFSNSTLDLLLNNHIFSFKDKSYEVIKIENYKYNFEILKLNLISLQDKVANSSFDLIEPDIEIIISNVADSFDSLFETVENELSVDLESDENSKLYLQIKSIRENINFKSFLLMFIKEYRSDIISYLLKDSSALILKYNVIQLKELIENYRKLLINLNDYMSEVLNKKNYKKFMLNYTLIGESLNDINEVLDLIYKNSENE